MKNLIVDILSLGSSMDTISFENCSHKISLFVYSQLLDEINKTQKLIEFNDLVESIKTDLCKL